MKKTGIALALALASFTIAAQAEEKGSGWYAGVKLGWPQYYGVGFHPNYDQNSSTTINSNAIHKTQLGSGALLGYQQNQNLGFELEYDWLGHMPYERNLNYGIFKAHGLHLSGKLSHPFIKNLDIYTRLGGAIWFADCKTTSYGNVLDIKTTLKSTGLSPLAAFGFEYKITKNLKTRIDYQIVSNIGDSYFFSSRPDSNTLSLGFSYLLGHSAVAVT